MLLYLQNAHYIPYSCAEGSVLMPKHQTDLSSSVMHGSNKDSTVLLWGCTASRVAFMLFYMHL